MKKTVCGIKFILILFIFVGVVDIGFNVYINSKYNDIQTKMHTISESGKKYTKGIIKACGKIKALKGAPIISPKSVLEDQPKGESKIERLRRLVLFLKAQANGSGSTGVPIE